MKINIEEEKVYDFLRKVQKSPEMLKIFMKQAATLSTKRYNNNTSINASKYHSEANSLQNSARKLESPNISIQTQKNININLKSQQDDYYFKFIHQQNRQMLKKNMLSQRTQRFVPFQVGQKVPLQERVQYYLKKLTDEEEITDKSNQLQKQKQISQSIPYLKQDSQQSNPTLEGNKNSSASQSNKEIQEQSIAERNQEDKIDDYDEQPTNLSPIRQKRKTQSTLPTLKIRLSKFSQASDKKLGELTVSQRLSNRQFKKGQNLFQSQNLEQDSLKPLNIRNSLASITLNNSINKSIEGGASSSNFQSNRRQQQDNQSFINRQSIVSSHSKRRDLRKSSNNPNSSAKNKLNNLNTLNRIQSSFSDSPKEERVMMFIKNLNIFKGKDHNQEIKTILEMKFRNILIDEYDQEQYLKALRLSKKLLKGYLQSHFGNKLAEKFLKLFEFIGYLDYENYFKQIEHIIQGNNVKLEDHIIQLKELAFELFDLNGDHNICEYDLFQIMKSTSSELFSQALSQDIKDINERINFKRNFLPIAAASNFNESLNLETKFKINNLQKFLDERTIMNDINENFLSVFTSPRTGVRYQGTSERTQSMKHRDDSSSSFNKNQEALFKYTQIQDKNKLTSFNKKSHQYASNTNKDSQSSLHDKMKRKNSISQIVQKVQDMYQINDIVYIGLDEFNKEIKFKYGLPMIILHFFHIISGFNFMERLKKEIFVSPSYNIINSFDENFIQVKQKINEKFYETHLMNYFNALGTNNYKDVKAINLQQIESKQSWTFDSLKKNMFKLFGIQHDYFAEIIFQFLSDGSINKRVSLFTILTKFQLLWPQKTIEEDDIYYNLYKEQNMYQKHQEELERLKQLNKLAFNILDIDKDGILSVLDLVRILTFFEEDSEIAVEVGKIIEIYKNKNVRPKYIRHKFIIDFDTFHNIINQSCIVKELQYVMVDQYIKPNPEYIHIFQSNPKYNKKRDLNEKRKQFNYDGIFNNEFDNLMNN